MKNFKKLLTVFLVLICSIGLISCKKSVPSSSTNQSSQPTQSGESDQSNQSSASNQSSPEIVLKSYIESLNSVDFEKALNLTNGHEVMGEYFNEFIEEECLRANEFIADQKDAFKGLKVSNIERINESENSVTLRFKLEVDGEPESQMYMESVFINQNDIWKIDVESEQSHNFINSLLP